MIEARRHGCKGRLFSSSEKSGCPSNQVKTANLGKARRSGRGEGREVGERQWLRFRGLEERAHGKRGDCFSGGGVIEVGRCEDGRRFGLARHAVQLGLDVGQRWLRSVLFCGPW